MWQALRDIVTKVEESLGIEVPAAPDPAAVTDAAAGMADQGSEAVTAATDAASSAATDAAGSAADAATDTAGEAVTGVGEQISGKVSDFLGRLGG